MHLAAVGLEAATKSYGSTTALAHLSCTFRPAVTVVLGRNGAGKSTLCKVLAGVETLTSGTIHAGSGQADALDVRQVREMSGYMPQHLAFPKGVRVSDYLAYAAWLKGLGADEVEAAVVHALEAVDLLDRRHDRLRTLSGGMLRRIGLAVATISDPPMLVLDEPTVGLDPTQRTHFYEMVALLASKACVVISTHLLEDAHELASRVVVLSSGAITFDGDLDELAAHGTGEQAVGRHNEAFRKFAS